eukprot:365810-Chlamydomonas_euryale.AAC.13
MASTTAAMLRLQSDLRAIKNEPPEVRAPEVREPPPSQLAPCSPSYDTSLPPSGAAAVPRQLRGCAYHNLATRRGARACLPGRSRCDASQACPSCPTCPLSPPAPPLVRRAAARPLPMKATSSSGTPRFSAQTTPSGRVSAASARTWGSPFRLEAL